MPLLLMVLLSLLAFPELIPDVNQQQVHRIVLSLPHEGFFPSEQQLAIADELNITLFEISNPLHLRSFPENQYGFFVTLGPKFSVPGLLSQDLSSTATEIKQQYQLFEHEASGRIVAASILRYPYESYSNFIRTSQALADSLTSEIPVPLYFHSSGLPVNSRPDGYNFVSERAFPGHFHSNGGSVVHFISTDNLNETYSYLNHTMNRLQEFDESILVLSAPWFFNQLDARSELRYLFRDFTEGNSVVLPLPAKSQQQPYLNWSIILLLIIWGSFAVHFRFQPIYSQSVIRYFTHHSFFVTDVYEHRLRNILPGFYLLIQHALLTGLFFLAYAELMISSQGYAVLAHHFPGLMIFGDNAFSLFIAGILFAVLLQGISVLWIYIANKELTTFSQILNLYSWPLHINLLVVTLLIVLYQIGFSESLTLIFGLLFILIWFFSFNIAAIDSSKYLLTTTSKVVFLTLTVGLHIFLVLGIFIYTLFTPSILEPILFAIEIP